MSSLIDFDTKEVVAVSCAVDRVNGFVKKTEVGYGENANKKPNVSFLYEHFCNNEKVEVSDADRRRGGPAGAAQGGADAAHRRGTSANRGARAPVLYSPMPPPQLTTSHCRLNSLRIVERLQEQYCRGCKCERRGKMPLHWLWLWFYRRSPSFKFSISKFSISIIRIMDTIFIWVGISKTGIWCWSNRLCISIPILLW